VRAVVEDLKDVRMPQLRDGDGLLLEAVAEPRLLREERR